MRKRSEKDPQVLLRVSYKEQVHGMFLKRRHFGPGPGYWKWRNSQRLESEIYLHNFGDSERQAIAVYWRATQKSHMDAHTKENEALDRFRTTA